MRKSLLALTAASALALGSFSTSTPAQAHAWWVVPAIVGGAVIGTAAVVGAANAYPYGYYGYSRPAYYGPGYVSVRPACRTVVQRTAYGPRRVRVCG